jgi:hypothetical protein
MGYWIGCSVEQRRGARAVTAAQKLHVQDLRKFSALFETARAPRKPDDYQEAH